MRDELEDKTILVTGGGSGIGRATAILAARARAKVVVADLDEKKARDTVSVIVEAGGSARARATDVSDPSDVEALIEYTVSTFGRIDGSHNNAGVPTRNKPIQLLTLPDWDFVQGVNVRGVFLCMKYEIEAMMGFGGGAIVNTASVAGIRGQINSADYVASKHGVVGLTQAAAIEAGPSGIRVNAVCPGLIVTPMADGLFADPMLAPAVDKFRERHSLGRFGTPEDVAEAVVWLLSDRASFVNGLLMTVDAGYSTH